MPRFYCLDTNVFITAWNVTYPPEIFPTLWKKLAENKEKIVVIEPVSQELKNKSDKLSQWVEKEFSIKKLTDSVNMKSLLLEKEFQIKPISKGVGSVDLKLVASAKDLSYTVVTLEKKQLQRPNEKCNYKIPLVCEEKGVNCINFIDFLKETTISI